MRRDERGQLTHGNKAVGNVLDERFVLKAVGIRRAVGTCKTHVNSRTSCDGWQSYSNRSSSQARVADQGHCRAMLQVKPKGEREAPNSRPSWRELRNVCYELRSLLLDQRDADSARHSVDNVCYTDCACVRASEAGTHIQALSHLTGYNQPRNSTAAGCTQLILQSRGGTVLVVDRRVPALRVRRLTTDNH